MSKKTTQDVARILNGGEWDVEWVAIEKLKPYAKNARKNDETVPRLKASIEQFGFLVPLVLDKNDVVVTGHTRLKAALLLGYTELPCVYAHELTPTEIDAFRLVDNRISEISEWDFEALNEQLFELKEDGATMDEFGFSDFSDAGIDDLFNPENQAEKDDEDDDDEGDAEETEKTRKISVLCPECGEEIEVAVTKADEVKK